MPEDLNFSDFPTLPITVWKELLSVMSHLDSLQLNSVHVELPLALSEVNIGAMQEKKQKKKTRLLKAFLLLFFYCEAPGNILPLNVSFHDNNNNNNSLAPAELYFSINAK